jgi:hypothetical protein
MLKAVKADSATSATMPAAKDHWARLRGLAANAANARPKQQMALTSTSVSARVMAGSSSRNQLGTANPNPDQTVDAKVAFASVSVCAALTQWNSGTPGPHPFPLVS